MRTEKQEDLKVLQGTMSDEHHDPRKVVCRSDVPMSKQMFRDIGSLLCVAMLSVRTLTTEE